MSDKKKIDDGGAAFPSTSACASWQCRKPSSGMTTRDYFAAAALQGLLANYRYIFDRGEMQHGAAKDAYSFADAMLAARKEGA
jgi:hypothetical protein